MSNLRFEVGVFALTGSNIQQPSVSIAKHLVRRLAAFDEHPLAAGR